MQEFQVFEILYIISKSGRNGVENRGIGENFCKLRYFVKLPKNDKILKIILTKSLKSKISCVYEVFGQSGFQFPIGKC